MFLPKIDVVPKYNGVIHVCFYHIIFDMFLPKVDEIELDCVVPKDNGVRNMLFSSSYCHVPAKGR